MRSNLSISVLQQVIDAAIDESCEIETASSGRVKRFGREEIGRKAFGVRYGAAPISRLGSDRNPLTLQKAEWILDAVQALLHDRCERASRLSGQPIQASTHLRRICRKLGFAGDVPEVNDLCLDFRLLSATSVEDLGFDNLARWDSSRPWRGAESKSARPRSMSILRQLPSVVQGADSVEQQLRLTEMAAALAMHHQPGTPGHAEAYNLAVLTAEAAHVFHRSERRFHDDATVSSALFARMHLLWTLVAPHMESSTNYLTYVMQRTPIRSNVLTPVLETLDEIDQVNRRRVCLESGRERARTDSASAYSVRARLLLAEGGIARLREADRAHAIALTHSKHAFHASCLSYPALREWVCGNNREAARACESAIADCLAHGRTAAGAYAGLHLQITHTGDRRIRKLARAAASSAQVSFLYSHVCNQQAVRRILSGRTDS